MQLRLIFYIIHIILAYPVYLIAAEPILVKAFKVQKYEFYEKFTAIGQCIRTQSRNYYATKTGIVDKITAKQGSKINSGELIIAIDSDLAENNLTYANATLDSAKLNYQRLKSLYDKKFVSKEQVEDARVSFERAEADYSKALKDYNDSIITAPFEGTIGVVNATIGNNVAVGDYLFSIITEKETTVFLELPETLYGQISQNTEVALNDSNGNKAEGHIIFITPYLSNKGTITIQIKTSTENHFIHNSYLSAEFTLNKHFANGIEQQTVLKNDKGNFVYKIDSNNVIKQLYLDLGLRTDNMIEVLSDNLQENDLIISEGLTKVQEGSEVKLSDT